MKKIAAVLILITTVSSSCKTTGSDSEAKGTPPQDPLIASFVSSFCSATNPSIDFLTSKAWSCMSRDAWENSFTTQEGTMTFRRDSQFSNLVTGSYNGNVWPFQIENGTFMARANRETSSGDSAPTNIYVGRTSDNRIYLAEQIGISWVGTTITAICQNWGGQTESGFVWLARCE
ncbi:MAG: hypothetical protein AB7T49_14555 [Oligoflexales bacterium]